MIDYDRIPYTPKASTGEHVRTNAFYNPVDEPETHGGRYERRKPMTEYISREDAKASLQEKVFHNLTDEFYGAMQVLDELPAADVVPVVRCKDCRYRVDPDKCCHPDGLLRSKDNDFCSYGERKE